MIDARAVAGDLGLPPDRLAEASVRRFWQCPAVAVGQALAADVADDELAAYVSEGRWVVGCPDCGGAQLAAREDRRFMCVECANVAVGGYWRRVVWPDDEALIEGALRVRPLRNQNWLPSEDVGTLLAENVMHATEIRGR